MQDSNGKLYGMTHGEGSSSYGCSIALVPDNCTFSAKAMMHLLQLHDLKLKSMKQMWFDSFYVSMLSEKYRSGRNNILSAFWNGFVSNCKAIMDKRKCSSIIYVIEK